MPDVVNDEETSALAAEYVLGTLDSDERARANELLEGDHQFRALVRVWEGRLGELHLMVEPVEPPAPIWDRIKAKIESVEPSSEIPLLAEAQSAIEPEAMPAASEAELRQDGSTGPEIALDGAPEAATRDSALETVPALGQHGSTDPKAGLDLPPETVTPDRAREGVPVHQNRETARDPHPHLLRWRLVAVFMALVAIALAGLISAWRYIPERLPPQLRAAPFLNIRVSESPPAPVRPPPPPESQFDE
jgi:hypothetical protein